MNETWQAKHTLPGREGARNLMHEMVNRKVLEAGGYAKTKHRHKRNTSKLYFLHKVQHWNRNKEHRQLLVGAEAGSWVWLTT